MYWNDNLKKNLRQIIDILPHKIARGQVVTQPEKRFCYCLAGEHLYSRLSLPCSSDLAAAVIRFEHLRIHGF